MVLRSVLTLVLGLSFSGIFIGCPDKGQATAQAESGTCEHGVKKELCARCNPELAAAFKAKNDWCAEHERPESQCVICHSDLAKQGIK